MGGFTIPDLTALGLFILAWLAYEPMLRRLSRVMGHADLCDDLRFATHAARVTHQAALYAIIAGWAAGQTADAVMTQLVAADIPASPVMSIADIAADPHFRERGTLVRVQDEDYGDMLMAAPIPRLSETPGSIRSLGPQLGAANEAIYGGWLGMSQQDQEQLRAAGII